MTCALPRRLWRAWRAPWPRGSSDSRRVMRRARARRSPRWTPATTSSCWTACAPRAAILAALEPRVGFDELDDLAGVGARAEDRLDAPVAQLAGVVIGDDAAAEDDDVLRAFRDEEVLDLGEERHVRARQAGQADEVDVLLDGRRDDLLRRLPEPGVDDLVAGVAQGAGDDLGAAVVAVQARLRDENADRALRHRRLRLPGDT